MTIENGNVGGGVPCANFGIAGEITTDGKLLRKYFYNEPKIGPWLKEEIGGVFSFSEGSVKISDGDFANKVVNRSWPISEIKYTDPRFPDLEFGLKIFAPIKENDAFVTSIPAVFLKIYLTNKRKDQTAEIQVDFSLGGDFVGGKNKISINANNTVELKFYWLANFDTNAFYTSQCQTAVKLKKHLADNWDAIENATSIFSARLPKSGYSDIDSYTRWYMVPGIILTRILKDGTVLTMGYAQLNQRDSFWASFLHLVYFPELEKTMIRESAKAISSAGKIPTTILPIIERHDDIDINEYFVLRIFRHYEYTKDIHFLKEHWSVILQAISWLEKRDLNNDGLPEQDSFWADWKDVPEFEGRKYGPHFCLLWLAVLEKAKKYALELQDLESSARFKDLFDKAFATINKDRAQGGLWNGKCYVNIWKDGKIDNRVLQDQMVGILFGVVSPERTKSIYQALDENGNKTEWGYREMWPGNGVYHNGGIWVYLNGADAFSRFVSGYKEEGLWILRAIGKADLEKDGDYMPHEYLNGITGAQCGMTIQAWDSVYFGSVYFGLLKNNHLP